MSDVAACLTVQDCLAVAGRDGAVVWFWLHKLFGRHPSSMRGCRYRVSSTLYSLDASRSAALLDFEFFRGTYIREQEIAAGGEYLDRFDGALVGPFQSPGAAERFIVSTAWFTGSEGA